MSKDEAQGLPSYSDKSVFISYCHDDNEEEFGDRWIEEFDRLLGIRLKKSLGRGNEPEIWRDRELQGNQDFTDKLITELQKASILISVLTPSYVKSEWCIREVDEFVSAAEKGGGLKVGDSQKRVFAVEKTPVHRSHHPEPLKGQTGYKFYLEDSEAELSLTSDTVENLSKAKERVHELSKSIVRTLEQLTGPDANVAKSPDTAGTAQAKTSAMPEDPATIYLAETSFDINEYRRELRRELEGLGHRVLPQGSLPISSPEEFNTAVRENLAQCDLCVQLVGAKPAHSPAGHRDDIVFLQNQIARDPTTDLGSYQIVWLPDDLVSDDQRQEEFINSLNKDAAVHGDAEVMQVPFHELLDYVHTILKKIKLEKLEETASDEPDDSSQPVNDCRTIYVCYAREDRDNANPLLDYLFEQDYVLLEPAFDEDARHEEVRELHKQNMNACDATLLFAQDVSESWVRSRFSELAKAPAYRNGRELVSSAIYLGGNMANLTLRTKKDLVIPAPDGFSPETIEPFTKILDSAKGQPS